MARSSNGKRYRGGIAFEPGSSMTQQQFKDECDINLMVKRFGGLPVPGAGAAVGRYGDFSTAPDFFEAQQLVLRARAQFDSLPSAVRRRFDNDPAQLLAFVGDKSNLDEARELGLLADEPVKPAVEPPKEKDGAK